MGLTYLDVELMLLPLLLAAWLQMTRRPDLTTRHWVEAIGALCLIATIWTTPWDNAMVATGVWSYPPEAVLGRIGYIPVEEQLFFVLQTALTGAWFGSITTILPWRESLESRRARLVGVLAAGAMVLLGSVLLVGGKAIYLGSLLAWFGFPLAIQLAWGTDRLARFGNSLLLGIVPPTIVLCAIDGIAIDAGTWRIHEETTIGLDIGWLPFEEIAFFAITNTLVVLGVALFVDLRERLG